MCVHMCVALASLSYGHLNLTCVYACVCMFYDNFLHVFFFFYFCNVTMDFYITLH